MFPRYCSRLELNDFQDSIFGSESEEEFELRRIEPDEKDMESIIYVSKYSLRLKTDPLGVNRYELMFPWGENKVENRKRASIGLRAQYSSIGSDKCFSNEFYIGINDVWPKFNKVILDIPDAELILLERDPKDPNTYRPNIEPYI